MLKEYLECKIQENEEKIRNLQYDIIQIQHKIAENENIAAVLKKETSSNAEIFSPRNHRMQNKEKLEQILINIEENRKKLDAQNKLLEDCLQKQKKYNEMMAETQKTVENEEIKRSEGDKELPQINSIEINEDAENENVSRETFFENHEEIEKERTLAGTRIMEGLRQLREIKDVDETAKERKKIVEEEDEYELKEESDKSKLNMEIKSGELIILESERKKERDFLEKVYIRVERSLAMLNGNKNMCKKELQQIKKMIYDYVQSIT